MKKMVFKFSKEQLTMEKNVYLHMFATIYTSYFCRLNSYEKVMILIVHKIHTLAIRYLLKAICIL